MILSPRYCCATMPHSHSLLSDLPIFMSATFTIIAQIALHGLSLILFLTTNPCSPESFVYFLSCPSTTYTYAKVGISLQFPGLLYSSLWHLAPELWSLSISLSLDSDNLTPQGLCIYCSFCLCHGIPDLPSAQLICLYQSSQCGCHLFRLLLWAPQLFLVFLCACWLFFRFLVQGPLSADWHFYTKKSICPMFELAVLRSLGEWVLPCEWGTGHSFVYFTS